MKKWLKYVLGSMGFFAIMTAGTLYLGKFDIKIIAIGTVFYLVVSMLCDFVMDKNDRD